VILLETSELLPDKHSTTVVEMVSRHVLEVLHALPSHPPSFLAMILVVRVHYAKHAKEQEKPEATVLREFHGTIVVHRM